MDFMTIDFASIAALATDYDGTLAENGHVSKNTFAALERFKASGRKLLLVTGRELPELKMVFPDLAVFDLVVAENGALLYTPVNGEERPLSPPPSPEFVARLMEIGVEPISIGKSIVATWEPHHKAVQDTINSMGLALTITLNKGAVMVLPAGINKATGLESALIELGMTEALVAGVGDAENDLAFLRVCGFSAAVSNALDSVKAAADMVTKGARGDGVSELIDAILTATR